MDSIIRVDDQVIVRKTAAFVRCGYPLTKEALLPEIRGQRREVMRLLQVLGVVPDTRGSVLEDVFPQDPVRGMKRLEDQLAYMLLHARGFGGHSRQIFEEDTSLLEIGRAYRVTAIRFCKTGTYYPPSYSYDPYSGGYDGDGGGLHDIATHKLLCLNTNMALLNSHVWVQACHVEKKQES